MVEVPVRMPKMSMTMTEGEVVSWHVAEGEHVARGAVVCEVLTDKVDMEVEAPAAGVVRRILHADGVVTVGEPIGIIEADEGEDTVDLLSDGDLEPPEAPAPPAVPEPSSAPQAPAATRPVSPPAVTRPAASPPAAAARTSSVQSSTGRTAASVAAVPRARALATRLGVDLTRVTGSGPDGLVREQDVRAAADAAGGRSIRRRDPRAAYARRMGRSAAVPQLTVREDVPVRAVAAARGGVSWTTVLLRALSAGLRAVPDARRMWLDDDLGDVAQDVAVSLAVAVPGGGVVGPVFVDADLPTDAEQVRDLDARLRRTVSLARRGRVEAALARPATATLSNVGGLGVASADALVAPPQAAVLTVGALRQALLPPGPGDAQQGWSPVLPLSLTLDHRVVDGVMAGALLAQLRGVLTDPTRALGGAEGVRAA